ncbi:hypothetical protein INT43_001692 [Umbelopsis isabellina]|uniref:Velvet domain-containing protein n=1 Tax=Mortierella isabellina TaxID=91625 RepID=A0A8H7PT98_MORIS|nr:hypothetical protein INT43_001692 [Umbelopsis isabellina]
MFASNHNQYHDPNRYKLVVRQQPIHARLCSFKEKVDRRPIDPPPIVQLQCRDSHCDQQNYLQNPFFFLVSSLQSADDLDKDNNKIDGHRTTAGTVVQSLHKLKNIDGSDGGFFIFPDISIRVEGHFRLRFTLFEIVGSQVVRLTSTLSEIFQVYSPKLFPGMGESTLLTRHLSDQGMRIRIRKENRIQVSKRKRSEDISDDDKHSCSQPSSPATSDSRPPSPFSTPDKLYQPHSAAIPVSGSMSPTENHIRLPPLKYLLQAIEPPLDYPSNRPSLPPLYAGLIPHHH